MDFEEINNDIEESLDNESESKIILNERISAKNDSKKIKDLFLKIAIKYDEITKNKKKKDDLNINENIEAFSDYNYNENKSSNEFNQFQKESIKEEKGLSESETTILKEWCSNSDKYVNSDGTLNVSFEELGKNRKREVYDEIMNLLSRVIKYLNEFKSFINNLDFNTAVYEPLKILIKSNRVLDKGQLKEKYIFYKRNKNEEEDYSDPIFALSVNYSEYIEIKLKIDENFYEEIAKELIYFISIIYFGEDNTINLYIEKRFNDILRYYKILLMLENTNENNEIKKKEK